MFLRPLAAILLGFAMALGAAAAPVQAAPSSPAESTTTMDCEVARIIANNVNMRATPGGAWVATAQEGDCLYVYGYTTNGPSVSCVPQVSLPTWWYVYDLRNERSGWVSGCYVSGG